jgi:hypothetical protein
MCGDSGLTTESHRRYSYYDNGAVPAGCDDDPDPGIRKDGPFGIMNVSLITKLNPPLPPSPRSSRGLRLHQHIAFPALLHGLPPFSPPSIAPPWVRLQLDYRDSNVENGTRFG